VCENNGGSGTGFTIGLGACVYQLLSTDPPILHLPQNCFPGKILEMRRDSLMYMTMDPTSGSGSLLSAGWGGKQSSGDGTG